MHKKIKGVQIIVKFIENVLTLSPNVQIHIAVGGLSGKD